MTTATGIEITARAAAVTVDTAPAVLASRVRAVAVGATGDGTLVPAGGGDVDPATVATDFAGLLGQPEPLVVGGTPYGVEALLAVLIGAGLADVARDVAADGVRLVALAHADDLDEYRRGLLVEAARLAAVPIDSVELVGHSEALTALAASGLEVADDIAIATGAALVALRRRPTAAGTAGGGAGGAAAGAAGLAAGGGAAAVIATSGGESTAVAADAVAGPAGTPLTAAPSGPAGTPLGGAPSGPAGTPLGAGGAGPGGTPLASAARTGTGLKVAIGVGIVAVVAAAGIGFAATRGGDDDAAQATTPTAAATASTDADAGSPSTTPDAAVVTTPVTDPVSADAAITTDASLTAADDCIIGSWTMDNAAFAAMTTAAAASEGATLGVISGTIGVDFRPDGTFHIDADGFTVEMTIAEGSGQMIWSGGDSGVWSANPDGTFTIESTTVGTTAVMNVTAEGMSMSIPLPYDEGALQGAQVAECAGDTLDIIQNTGDLDHIPLVRD